MPYGVWRYFPVIRELLSSPVGDTAGIPIAPLLDRRPKKKLNDEEKEVTYRCTQLTHLLVKFDRVIRV